MFLKNHTTPPTGQRLKQKETLSSVGLIAWRWKILVLVVLCAWVVMIMRLAWIQLVKHPEYGNKADIQYIDELLVYGTRGTIFDCRGRALAIDLPNYYSIGGSPQILREDIGKCTELAKTLGIPTSRVLSRLGSSSPFIWITRGVDQDHASQVEELRIPGIRLAREPKRYYPFGSIAGQILGTTDCDRKGIAGLEAGYEKLLRGQNRIIPYWTDARHTVKVAMDEPITMPRGQDITLTIDLAAQSIAEEELAIAVENANADWGVAIVMEPMTGRINALASYPSFNPNNPAQTRTEFQRCRAITDMLEPGSTFKIVTAATALESGKISPDDKFHCENGKTIMGGRVFHDAHPYGILTFREIIEKSSNIGTAKIGYKLGAEALYSMARGFGFGQSTQIELAGEAEGILHQPSNWSKSSLGNFCIGQGISLTPLQLAMAYAAVANGGYLLRPQIIQHGDPDQPTQPITIRRVLSPYACETLKQFFVGVVKSGTGKSAAIDGITVAGKTGTAQKVDTLRHTYYQDRYVASFVGFAPTENPQCLVLVIIDDPRGLHYGSQVAAPAFKRIMERWLSAGASQGIVPKLIHPKPKEPKTNQEFVQADTTIKDTTTIDEECIEPELVSEEDTCMVMPSLVGIPVRSAVRELTEKGIEVIVSGYGTVQAQLPEPGTALEPGTRCQLIGENAL
jgi:cell division protein FtsI (penicillin-binding protein 3)